MNDSLFPEDARSNEGRVWAWYFTQNMFEGWRCLKGGDERILELSLYLWHLEMFGVRRPGLHTGITTAQIDTLAAETCAWAFQRKLRRLRSYVDIWDCELNAIQVLLYLVEPKVPKESVNLKV